MAEGRLAFQWDAFQLWEALTQGEWVLVQHHDEEGRRHLLVRPLPPDQRAPALRTNERCVASLAQRGLSSKQIAFELGVSPAAISRHLGAALRKLGLRNASELSRSSTECMECEAGPPSGVVQRRNFRLLPPPGLEIVGVGEDGQEVVLAFPLLRAGALESLSPVEREVVSLLVAGHSVPEVARARGRSRHTIDNQVRTIYAKLGITCRQELVRAALG